jgi:hypothetical protein
VIKIGAWHYGPFDNDIALDFSANLNSILLDGLSSQYNEEKRAAANIIKIIGSGHLYDEAYAALNSVLNDDEWINNWDDPEQVLQQIEAELGELRA